jgi:hypothetical protein
MKAILTVFFSIIALIVFSGDLNKPILKCSNPPDISSNSHRILIVINANTGMDQQSVENCINGFEITLDLQSQSKITDKIFVEKNPDSKAIAELQKNHTGNGLLLLYKLKMKKKAYDVQIQKPHLFPASHDKVNHPAYWGTVTIPWTNLYAQITSKWKFYDLNSGKQYDFEIKNKKIFELRRYVSNIDSLVDANQTMFDPLLYENGKIMAEKLLKAKTND